MKIRVTNLVVWVYAAISFGAAFVTSETPIRERLIISGGVTVLSIALILVMRRFGRSIFTIAAIALFVGLIRGLVLVVAVAVVNGVFEPMFVLRIASSALSAVIWIVGISWVVANLAGYRQRYLDLVGQVSQHRASRDLDENADLAAMKLNLAGAVTPGDTNPTDIALRRAAQIIRWEVEHRVRPLSHRVWFTPDAQPPRVRVVALVIDAIKEFPVPVLPVTLLWLFAALVGAPVIFGLQQGIASAVVSSLLLALSLVLGREAARTWHTRWIGPSALVLSVAVPIAGAIFLVPFLPTEYSDASVFVLFVFVPFALAALIITASAIALAQSDRTEILRIVETRLQEPEPFSNPAVSSYLHNTVQSELTGLALQLERAEVGSTQAHEAWERLVAIAGRSIESDFQQRQGSVQERVHRIEAAWRGIAEITCEMEPDILHADPRMLVVVQAISEITTNAVRHGGADRIDFQVRTESEYVTLLARTNAALTEPAAPGVGGRWLASVSAIPIEVTSNASETFLIARF